MFKKELVPKQENTVGGKDAKKLRSDMERRFGAAEVEALLPSKSTITLQKFGGGLRLVLYSLDKRPWLLDTTGNGDFVPTIEALWSAPALVPRIEIHAPVSRFVVNGADLMIPGMLTVSCGLPSSDFIITLAVGCCAGVVRSSVRELDAMRIVPDAVVSIGVRGNPAAIAVGKLLVTVDELRLGGKGRAVQIVHHYRDMLWVAAGRRVPNLGFLDDCVVPILGSTRESDGDADGDAEVVSDEDPDCGADSDGHRHADGDLVGGQGAISAADGSAVETDESTRANGVDRLGDSDGDQSASAGEDAGVDDRAAGTVNAGADLARRRGEMDALLLASFLQAARTEARFAQSRSRCRCGRGEPSLAPARTEARSRARQWFQTAVLRSGSGVASSV